MRIDNQEMLKVLQEMIQVSERSLESTSTRFLFFSENLSLCQ
jgi:hypothetical protein